MSNVVNASMATFTRGRDHPGSGTPRKWRPVLDGDIGTRTTGTVGGGARTRALRSFTRKPCPGEPPSWRAATRATEPQGCQSHQGPLIADPGPVAPGLGAGYRHGTQSHFVATVRDLTLEVVNVMSRTNAMSEPYLHLPMAEVMGFAGDF